jgi:pSer/pThr/pTyr-binding forkhead associated (FHA) protein
MAKTMTDADASGLNQAVGRAGAPSPQPASAGEPAAQGGGQGLQAPKTPDRASVSGAIHGGPSAATPPSEVPSGEVKTPDNPVSHDPPSEQAHRATVGPGASASAVAVEQKRMLARIVSVRRDGSDGEVQEISDETVDLGRNAGGLTFADDPYLSDRHCRFYLKNGRWMVRDLSSCNGVYLRIRETVSLEHLDTMLLGKQVLVFERLSEHERELGPAVENGVLVFGSPLRTPWARLRQMTVAGISRDVYHLVRPRVTVGREDGDILFPDDEFMSRKHLAMSLVDGHVQLQDLGSSNGTYIRIQEPRELAPGAMIRVGDQLLRFEVA